MTQNGDTTYSLLDSGNGRKLERFGKFVVDRPAAAAVWRPKLPDSEWAKADARFVREGANEWSKKRLPNTWVTRLDGLSFLTKPTDFGHLGLFPEHLAAWRWMDCCIRQAKRDVNVLNLFAYTGAASLAAARAGATVTNLDAARRITDEARENAAKNKLEDRPIRWIVDDCLKFLRREVRRERHYDGFIMDPPNYGRGAKGEVFKIEENLTEILDLCRQLFSPQPLFMILTCHANGYTPLILQHLVDETVAPLRMAGTSYSAEMCLEGGAGVFPLPIGAAAVWHSQDVNIPHPLHNHD